MKITRTENETEVTLSIEGEILGQAGLKLTEMIDQIKGEQFKRIIIDMAQADTIDSYAIGALIYSQMLLSEAGKELVITAPKSQADELLHGCAIDKAIKIINSPED